MSGGPLDQASAVARRRWPLAAIVFLLTAAAGLTVARSLPNVYRSAATVLVEQSRLDAAPQHGDLDSRLQLISQEILSRSALESLIRVHGLYPRLVEQTSMAVAVSQMRRDIRTDFKSGLGSTIAFTVSYRSTDPEIVATVANALAAFYIEGDRKLRDRQTTGALQVLRTQLDELKQGLREQELALAEFQVRHQVELPQNGDANLANLQRLHAELRTATEERMRSIDRRSGLVKELAELRTMDAAGSGGPDPAAVRLAQRREELAALRRRYSDKFPDVIRLQEEVAALEAALPAGAPGAAASSGDPGRSSTLLRDALADVDAEIKTRRLEEAKLRADIADHIRRLENAPRLQRTYQELSRDYTTRRDLYDTVRKRYEQAQLEEAEGGPATSPFRILEPALRGGPVAPNRLMLMIVALLGASGLALAAVLAAESIDRSFHSVEDVRTFTRVSVLASIPRITTERDVRWRRMRLAAVALGVLLAIGLVVKAAERASARNEGLALMLGGGRS
jgi:polysaccharide chain length determinant protein (PEP-CTERM system associated)